MLFIYNKHVESMLFLESFVDLASRMLEDMHELALECDEYGGTALHILAQMPSEFGCQILEHPRKHTMKNYSSN